MIGSLSFMLSLASVTALAAESPDPALLRDGIMLQSVDGTLRQIQGQTAWFFVADADIIDGPAVVAKGTYLELLPSSVLETWLDSTQDRIEIRCRLWAQVTQYKGRNFLVATHFILLPKEATAKTPVPDDVNQVESKPADEGTTGPLGIPAEVIRQVQEYQPVEHQHVESATPRDKGQVLLARTGRLVYRQRRPFFVPDGVGLDLEGTSFEVLPCTALESMELLQGRRLEPIRFDVAGILMRYHGQRFLLPNRAVRTYSFGNFNR